MSKDLLVERLFACDALLGRPYQPHPFHEPTLSDMKERFERFPIERALVRSAAGNYAQPDLANAALRRMLEGQTAFEGVFQAEVLDVNEQLEQMQKYGLRAVTLKGNNNYRPFPLFPWCCGDLYEILEEKKIPLLLEWGNIVPNELHEAMKNFPGMRVILLTVPRNGRQSIVEMLMKQHDELYLCLHTRFSVFGGYPALCRQFGNHRFVWGCNYPDAEEGAAVTGLFYSGLDPESMEAVAHGNMERLLSEVTI